MNPNKRLRLIVVSIIKFYRNFISPFFPPACRFYPTCSEYSMQAVSKYGTLKGGYLIVVRILKCNPFSKGGFDPLK